MANVAGALGAQTLAEILGHPRCWIECFESLREQNALEKILQQFTGDRERVFIGCGSSYYTAQVAAASCPMLTGRRARAWPASEKTGSR